MGCPWAVVGAGCACCVHGCAVIVSPAHVCANHSPVLFIARRLNLHQTSERLGATVRALIQWVNRARHHAIGRIDEIGLGSLMGHLCLSCLMLNRMTINITINADVVWVCSPVGLSDRHNVSCRNGYHVSSRQDNLHQDEVELCGVCM